MYNMLQGKGGIAASIGALGFLSGGPIWAVLTIFIIAGQGLQDESYKPQANPGHPDCMELEKWY